MKNGWQIVPMGQLCSIKSGKSDTKDAVEDGAYAFFDRSRTIKKSSRYLYDCEALIIPGEGTEFLPKHFVGKFDLHQRAYALFEFSDRIDVKFLYYFLHHLCDYFPRVAVGATVKSLRLRHFEQLPVALTGLPEQQRIVGILDEAFEDITTAKANAEKNLQNARALFESYLQSVFTHRGPGWMEKPLGSIATFRNGINYTKDSKGESIRIVGVRNFQKNFFAPLDDLDTITIDGKLSEMDSLKQDDILAVRSNGNIELIGRCLLVGEVTDKISHSGFTIRIRLAPGEVLPSYLCHFMKSASSRKRLTEGGTGTNIKSLNQGMLSALTVPFPPVSAQKLIVEKLEHISEETKRLESIYRQKLATLEALKKSLLYQSFTGKL